MGLQLRIFGGTLSESAVIRLAYDGLTGSCSGPEVGFWEVMNMLARRLRPSDALTGSWRILSEFPDLRSITDSPTHRNIELRTIRLVTLCSLAIRRRHC